MRHLVLVAAFGLAFALPAAADEIDDLVERYVNLPANQAVISNMFSPEVLTQRLQVSLSPNAKFSDEQIALLGELLSEELQKFRPVIQEAMANATATHFTKQEIQALIDFYRTDLGASVRVKMNAYTIDIADQVMSEFNQLEERIVPDIFDIVLDRS